MDAEIQVPRSAENSEVSEVSGEDQKIVLVWFATAADSTFSSVCPPVVPVISSPSRGGDVAVYVLT